MSPYTFDGCAIATNRRSREPISFDYFRYKDNRAESTNSRLC